MTAIASKNPKLQTQSSQVKSPNPPATPSRVPPSDKTPADFFPVLAKVIPVLNLVPLAVRLAGALPLSAAKSEEEVSSDDPEKFYEKESKALDKLESELVDSLPENAETGLEQLKKVEALAQQYLQLGAREDGNAAQLLAERTYELLEKVSGNSDYSEIKKRAPLYGAYRQLAQGDFDGAKAAFTVLRADFGEAWDIVKRMKSDEIRGRSLKALYAWEVFIEEGQEKALDEAHGMGGVASGMITKLVEGKTSDDFVYEKIRIEKDLISAVRKQLLSGKEKTIDDALLNIEDPRLKPRAHELLAQRRIGADDGSHVIAHMIRYVSDSKLDVGNGEDLLRDADQCEARFGVKTAYAMYSLLRETAASDHLKNTSAEKMNGLEQGKGVGARLWDMIRTTSLDEVAYEVLVMKGCQTLGALAKLATLTKLSEAGITGYKATALAFGAEALAEGGAFGTMQLAQEAANHDVEKSLTTEHILKVYASNLIMIGGLKQFGNLSAKYAPRAARALEMVKGGGEELSKGGEILVGSMNHVAGFGGMVATNQLNQKLGLSETPEGGFLESLAHDAFSYLKYGIAQKGLGGLMGPELEAKSQEIHQKILELNTALIIEANLKSLGYEAPQRTEDGTPIFKDAKTQKLYIQLIRESLTKPGFDAGKLSGLLREGKIAEAEGYAKGFGTNLDQLGMDAKEIQGQSDPGPWAEDLEKIGETFAKAALLACLGIPETAQAGEGGPAGMGPTEMGMIVAIGAVFGLGYFAKRIFGKIKSSSKSKVETDGVKPTETKAKMEEGSGKSITTILGLGLGLGALLGPEHAQAAVEAFSATNAEVSFPRFLMTAVLGVGMWGMVKWKPRGVTDLLDLQLPDGPVRKQGNLHLDEVETTSRHVNGVPSAVDLKVEKRLGADILPAGTRLFYSDKGRLYAIRPSEPCAFGGIEYGHGDRLFFDADARLEFVALGEGREIQGVDCAAGFPVRFDTSGNVVRAKLARKQVRADGVFQEGEVVDIKAGVMLHEENVLKQMLWTAVSGISFIGNCYLLSTADLSSPFSSALGLVNFVGTFGSLYYFTRELNWMRESIPELPEDPFPKRVRVATQSNPAASVPPGSKENLEKEYRSEMEMEAEEESRAREVPTRERIRR
ncbi:MAG: hypothetical protein K8R69_03045 [Deltaproteobacteria bacterium]|nr:hypothetical protein [Deltaproteobacteria bacterium]